MPGPERSPGLPPTEGKVKGGERFAIVETHLPGVFLRTEPGIKVDILRKTIGKLYDLAGAYAKRKFRMDKLGGQQKEADSEIKELAQTYEGLRGIQSEEDKFVLSVFPRKSVTFDNQLLKESLGIAYSSVVHEDLVVSIAVPAGFQTERGPVQEELLHQVLTQALLDLGLKDVDLEKIMGTKVQQRVDEKTLEEMIKSGRVKLLEGTKKTATTWAITVEPLKKSPRN